MPQVASNDPGNDSGMIRSHRFPGANTALPTANRDDVQLQTVIDFLKAGQVTVDLFALVRGGELPEGVEVPAAGERRIASTFAVGEESELSVPPRMGVPAVEEIVTAPLNRDGVALVRGESVRVDAVVRTRNVGHFFPGGTVDAFDVWLELQAVDDAGTGALLERVRRGRRKRSGRARGAFLPIVSARRTREQDQQAERVVDEVHSLREPHSSGRSEHRSISSERARGRRARE